MLSNIPWRSPVWTMQCSQRVTPPRVTDLTSPTWSSRGETGQSRARLSASSQDSPCVPT